MPTSTSWIPPRPYGFNADGNRTLETQYHPLAEHGGRSTSGVPWVPARDFDRLADQCRTLIAEVGRLAARIVALYRYRSIAGDLWNELETIGHDRTDGPCDPGCPACQWGAEYQRVDTEVRQQLATLGDGLTLDRLLARVAELEEAARAAYRTWDALPPAPGPDADEATLGLAADLGQDNGFTMVHLGALVGCGPLAATPAPPTAEGGQPA